MEMTNYREKLENLLKPDICRRLFMLHEYRGRQELVATGKPVLDMLRPDVAIESVQSACFLEGRRFTAGNTDVAAIKNHLRPPTKTEAAAAGFFDTFQILQDKHGADRFSTERIAEIHSELFFMYSGSFETSFRTNAPKNKNSIPFPAEDLPAEQIDNSLKSLLSAYKKLIKQKTFDEILLISVFLIDFICIYPYNEGFPRLFLLVTRLLLKHAGYMAIEYVSFESELAKNAKQFQDSVFNSTVLWNKGENDYTYFTIFLLDTLLAVYEKFEGYANAVSGINSGAKDSVKALFTIREEPLSRQDIAKRITSVTSDRIKQILRELTDEGFLIKKGEGKNTSYTSATRTRAPAREKA